MKKLVKQIIIVLFVVVFVITPVSVLAGDRFGNSGKPTAASMAGDILILRPAGVIATVATGILFVITLPFSALGGNVKEAAEATVLKSVRYTFVRPIGEGM